MSTPVSSIALMARGLTWVASVPALCASKRSPARRRSRPSAICERAELCVHRNRTLVRPPASAAAATHTPLLAAGQQMIGGFAKQFACGLPIEGEEAPLPAPLLAHQPRVLELLHVVGDLRLAHAEVLLELADADSLIPLDSRNAGVREVAATPAIGHHGERPYPDGVREGTAQGYEPVHPEPLGSVPADAVLLHDPELLGTHSVPRSEGLRPRMNALASGTSAEAVVAAVVAVSPQQPEPPQQPEASANSSS